MSERTRKLDGGEGNSFAVEYDIDWPEVPRVEIRRSILVLLALTAGFTLMALFGDAAVAGRAGNLIALAGLLGVVVVFPTLVSRCLRRGRSDSIFTPDRESEADRRPGGR